MPNILSRRWLLLPLMLLACVASFAQIISVTFAPPALPVYSQPLCPGEGYIWTPGYWDYDYNFGDYYWVPGTWVLAPEPGLLWTPPWWGWADNVYIFHAGYWGPQVGFYGGIPYGYGYFGHGYEGGRWEHGQFYYNRAVNNINVTDIHNVYNTRVAEETNVHRISYNGGNGGIDVRPTPEEEAAARERHVPPVAVQVQHRQTASANPELRASANRGKPPVAATDKPTAFTGAGVVPAKEAGAPWRPPANVARATSPVHAKDLPPAPRPPTPNTGEAQSNKEYQQQQEKLYQQQEKERQQLEKSQEQDHQRLAQQNANAERAQQAERTQQMEQMHQQQTQQMMERHAQQQQQLQRQSQSPHNGQPPKKQ